MNIKDLMKFVNIDGNFYNLLKLYESDPKQYEKEVLMEVIERTKYDKEIIKQFTNDYTNSLILKTYLGKDDKEIFDNMKKAATDEKNNSEYFYQIYTDIIKNSNVSIGYKKSLAESVFLMSTNGKYGNRIGEPELKYGEKALQELLSYVKHTDDLELKDMTWINEIVRKSDLETLNRIVIEIGDKIRKENPENLNENQLKSLRELFLLLISTMKPDKNSPVQNKSQSRHLLKLGKWFVNNLKDMSDDYPESNRKRIYGGYHLLLSFKDLQPHLEVLEISDIEEMLFLDIDKFKQFLEQKSEVYIDKENFKNIRIYFKDLYKYFKNTPYFNLAYKRFFDKIKEQIEDMKKYSKLTIGLSDNDIIQMKKVFEYRSMSDNKERYFKDIKESNIELCNKLKEELGLKQKDYSSYVFQEDNSVIFDMHPIQIKILLKELFTTDIDTRIGFLIQESSYESIPPYINTIVSAAVNDNPVMQINSKNTKIESLKKNQRFFNEITELYQNMNDINKNNVLPFIFNYISDKETFKPEYKYFIEETIKFKGLIYIIPSVLTKITDYNYEKLKHSDMFGNEYKEPSGENNLEIFNLYIKNNLKKYCYLEDKQNKKSIVDLYYRYLHSIDEKDEKIYFHVLDEYNKNLTDNDYKKRNFLNKLNTYIKNSHKGISEKLLLNYFDEYKNDIDFVLSAVDFAYRWNLEEAIVKFKNYNFGNNVQAMGITKSIKSKEIIREKEKIDNLKLPTGVIPITNEKRQEALSIIENSLDDLFKNKKKKDNKEVTKKESVKQKKIKDDTNQPEMN